MSSEAQGRSTAYGPGGWRSKARQKSRPDVVEAVQLAARTDLVSGQTYPPNETRLLAAYVAPLKGSFKINQASNGPWWYKVGWPTPTGPVYLAACYEQPVTAYAGLVDLCEQIEEVKRGLRKPSPDRWRGDKG